VTAQRQQQQQSGSALRSMRVPLVGPFQNRNGQADKDQRYINCFPESLKAAVTEQKKIYLYQRPGLAPLLEVIPGVARGVKYWNGKYYSVIGNKLYSDDTELQTLTTATGQCSFEIGTVIAGNVLVLADGDFVYVIEPDETITVVPLVLETWQPNTAYDAGDRIKPSVGNGFYYEAISAGTSLAVEPTWPNYLGETLTEGTTSNSVVALTLLGGGSGYVSAPTVTIDAPKIIFNGSSTSVVSVTDNTISYNNHLFETADAVVYNNGGGTSLGGLTSGTTYYINKVDANTVKLYTTAANATSGGATGLMDITSVGAGTTHYLQLTGASASAATATATCTISGGSVNTFTITSGGSKYSADPNVTISAPPSGSTATASASTTSSTTLTWEAKGYTNSAGAWQASADFTVGQQIAVTIGSIQYLFAVSVGGTTGSSQPEWSITLGQSTVDNTVTWSCLGEFRDDSPPKYHKPSLAFLDGSLYLILQKVDGSNSADIYNCDTDNPYSWNPINYIVAEQFPDNLRALARQNNMLVAFGDDSTEFFYDAGNVAGSPLARNTSYTLQVGIAAPDAIYQNEKFCLFIGQSQSGGRAAWLLDGFVPKKVSDEYIERILDANGTNIINATGYGLRTNGHLFYIINLVNSDGETEKTLVYDLEERMWHEWSGVNCVAMTDDESGKAILQHATNGKLYYLDPDIGTDDGENILMEVFTTKYDFDTMNIKGMHSINIVSDRVGTDTTIDIRWSDDDYRTWSDWRTLNFNPRAYFCGMGSFRRRAFNIQYSGGLPARFESLEFDLRLWKA
jgi:Phage stabilisation protein